jgi:DNA-binding beta-propeller fold protein YncE
MLRDGHHFKYATTITSILLGACISISACGGGSQGGGTPPPPQSDYSLLVGPNTLILQQAGAPQQFTIEFTPIGSSPAFTVTVSFPNLPAGVSVDPPGPVTLVSDTEVQPFLIQANSSASVGAISVNISTTNGAVNHSATLPVTVNPAGGFQLQLSSSTISLTPGGFSSIQATAVSNTGPPPNVGFDFAANSSEPGFTDPTISGSGPGPYTITFSPTVDAQPVSNVPIYITAVDNTNANNVSTAVITANLTVPFPAITAATRSTYVRTDDVPSAAVYDIARKLVFSALPDLNEVRVFSSVDAHLVATIPVEHPGSIDESADGSKVYVGGLGEITTIDPSQMQVTQITSVTQTTPGAYYVTPVQIAALSNGKVLFVNYSGGHVFLWDPLTQVMSSDDPPNYSPDTGPTLNRSGDHSRVLLTSPIVVYSVESDTYGQRLTGVEDGGASFAINLDGSRIALFAQGLGGETGFLNVYDGEFDLLTTVPLYSASFPGYGIFSVDGSTLYAFIQQVSVGDEAVAYDTATMTPKGLFEFGVEDQTTVGFPLAVDETGMIFGDGFEGFGLIFEDASHPGELIPDTSFQPTGITSGGLCTPGGNYIEPGTLNLSTPSLDIPYVMCPSAMGIAGGNGGLVGNSFDSKANYGLYVGAPPGSPSTVAANGLQVISPEELDFKAPATTVPGPANLTLTRSDGWYQIIPDGINYGPTILGIEPSVVPTNGQVTLNIYGYGLQGATDVTIGGASAQVVSSGPYMNNVDFVLPLQTLQVTVPAGAAGPADVTVKNASVSTTRSGGIQYLASANTYPVMGQLDAVVYDQTRQRLYLANTDHNQVEVFDLGSQSLLSPIPVGDTPTGIALVPDGSELAALNSADGTVSVIDPAQMKVTATYPAITMQDMTCQGQAVFLQAIQPHRVLVDTTCNAASGNHLHVLNLDTGSLACTGIAGCDATGVNLYTGFIVGAMSSTPDGSKVIFTSGISQNALLDLNQNTLAAVPILPITGPNTAADADDNIFAVAVGTFNGQRESISTGGAEYYFNIEDENQDSREGEALNPSGSLLFVPNNGVDVFDVHRGRLLLRISLPDTQDQSNAYTSIALDETGTKMFVITRTGITVAQLAEVPLSIASVNPSSGGAGTQVKIRGSGFSSGTTVQIGGTAATATYIDGMTLQVTVPSVSSGPARVTVTNLDGTEYSFDAAFNVN